MAPAREWQRRSTPAYASVRIRNSCLSPKPETLNPETGSGTSGTGPGPGPLYTPPATRKCETEQSCGVVSANPTVNSEAIPVRMAMQTYEIYEQLSIHAAGRQCEKSLLKLCGDQRPPTRRNRRFLGTTHRMISFKAASANTNVRPRKHQLLGASTKAFATRTCEAPHQHSTRKTR